MSSGDRNLHPWQQSAIDYFMKHGHCIIQAATGTGKTFLALHIIQRVFRDDSEIRVLVVVPKNVIIDSWYTELSSVFSLPDIGVYYGDIKEKSRITITNMQNIEFVGFNDFDFVIFDELHNYTSRRLESFLQREKTYKLGLTATLSKEKEVPWNILRHFYYNIYNYDIHSAVEDDILASFRFYNVSMELPDTDFDKYQDNERKLHFHKVVSKNEDSVPSKEQKYSALNVRKEILGNNDAKLDVFDNLVQRGLLSDRKLIIFNELNKFAMPCYWKLTELGFRPCIFHTGISKQSRYDNLELYRQGVYDTIITTRALDEGYNLPQIDAAVIMCGGNNSRQLVQRAGRVLRKKNRSAEIYQVFFRETIEEEYAMKNYEKMRQSCEQFYRIDI